MTTEGPKSNSVAAKLRIAREQAGLSQGQVAKLLGLHRPSISEMEAGRRKVSAEELAKMADMYAVSVAWLTGTDSEIVDVNDARLQLAARELAKLKPEDLKRLMDLLAVLRLQEDTE